MLLPEWQAQSSIFSVEYFAQSSIFAQLSIFGYFCPGKLRSRTCSSYTLTAMAQPSDCAGKKNCRRFVHDVAQEISIERRQVSTVASLTYGVTPVETFTILGKYNRQCKIEKQLV